MPDLPRLRLLELRLTRSKARAARDRHNDQRSINLAA